MSRRRLGVGLAILGAIAILTVFDRSLHLRLSDPTREVEHAEWYQMLRAVGYLPTWLLVGAAVLLHDRRRGQGVRRAIVVWLGPTIAGIIAELLKLLVGRERPVPHDGEFVFKPFLSGFLDGSNLGMPSSHTAVAFGGAGAIALLIPGTAPVVLAMAGGCAVTRVISGAHFVSDIFVGALVGYAVARSLVHLFGARVRGQA